MKNYNQSKAPDIRKLKNKEKGRRAFILGNGPSISNENLANLKDELTIGINGSTFLESNYGFSSQYYVVSDQRFLDHRDKIKFATSDLSQSTLRVFREGIKSPNCNDYKHRTYYIKSLGRDGFSHDLRKGFFFGCSTVNLAIQLAYYLGAKEIYLLGVDLSYTGNQLRFYDEKDPSPVDPYRGTQVHNITTADHELQKEQIGLYNCSKSSVLRPYLGFTPFKQLFSNV